MFAYTPEFIEARDRWVGIGDGPDKPNRKHRQGIPVYQNWFVEHVLSRSHWVLPGVWFLPLTGWCLFRAVTVRGLSLPTVAALFAAGVLAWTLMEYVLHRWIMHLPPGTSEWRRTFLFMAHGYHHEFPDDPWRLVAPPLMSWPLAAIVATVYWLTLGPAFEAVLAGTFVGYIAYDWIHYYTHHARPKGGIGRYLRQFHILHHFRDHDAKFGISSPLWDVVLRTYGPPVRKKSSQIAA